jgi:uncharacterized protein
MKLPNELPRATLSVRVRPRASKTAILGRRGDTLHLQVAAPPLDGAANEACLALLSKFLRTPLSSKRPGDAAPLRVALIKGAHSRAKVVRIFGLTQYEVQARLEALPALSSPSNA